MYIILNEKPLGLAFNVPENTLDGIYPVVKFHGNGLVEIEERVDSDAPIELEPVKPLILEGNWTLHVLDKDETPANKITMKISEIYDRVYDRAYRLRIIVRNKFIGKLLEKSTANWIGEIVDKTVSQGTTAEMELETIISKHISGIKNVVLDSLTNELRLESIDSTSVWKQIEPKPNTVDWNPFNKMKK